MESQPAAGWDHASRGYAEHVAPALMEGFTEAMVDRLAPAATANVLEVGAGSGALTVALYPRVASVLATDFSAGMIAVLQERLQQLGTSNVRCAAMDGQALEVEDGQFDAAASSFALMLFEDVPRGFAELHRAVRSGGRVVVSGWAGPEKFESFGLFLTAVGRAFPDLPAPTSTPPVFRLADLDQFRALMEAAGFRDVEVDVESRPLSVPGFAEMWKMLTVGAPPIQALFDQIGAEGQQRLRDVLQEVVVERFGSGPIVTNNVATIALGTV